MLQRPCLLAALIKFISQHEPHSFPVVLDCSTLVASVSEVFANIIMNLQKEGGEPEKVIAFTAVLDHLTIRSKNTCATFDGKTQHSSFV